MSYDAATVKDKQVISARQLREIVLSLGADDVGFVKLSRPEIDSERKQILEAFPHAKTLISYLIAVNIDAIRSPARSIANLEFHLKGEYVNTIGTEIIATLAKTGVRGINPALGFPMETMNFPGKMWVISHKIAAEAAGLGKMGLNRLILHPKFGSNVLLGTVIIDAEIEEENFPVKENPCFECKLCVAACPVGAIGKNGEFNFSACYTHNYREFMGGFTNWVEEIADSKNSRDYRKRVSDRESVSMWQSLSYGANYKAAYCMAVCPAGENVIAEYNANKAKYMQDVVRPLQNKKETVYVIPGSDAETITVNRFKNKTIKHVGNGLRPNSIEAFLFGLPLVFQPGQAKKMNLNAVYHFTFTGSENKKATIKIQRELLEIKEDHIGKPSIHVTVDTDTWIKMLAKEYNEVIAVIRGKMKVKGPLKLMKQFSACFPS